MGSRDVTEQASRRLAISRAFPTNPPLSPARPLPARAARPRLWPILPRSSEPPANQNAARGVFPPVPPAPGPKTQQLEPRRHAPVLGRRPAALPPPPESRSGRHRRANQWEAKPRAFQPMGAQESTAGPGGEPGESAPAAPPPPPLPRLGWQRGRLPPPLPARLPVPARPASLSFPFAAMAATAAEQEQQQFYLLLGNLLSPDNAVRKQAEVTAPPRPAAGPRAGCQLPGGSREGAGRRRGRPSPTCERRHSCRRPRGRRAEAIGPARSRAAAGLRFPPPGGPRASLTAARRPPAPGPARPGLGAGPPASRAEDSGVNSGKAPAFRQRGNIPPGAAFSAISRKFSDARFRPGCFVVLSHVNSLCVCHA